LATVLLNIDAALLGTGGPDESAQNNEHTLSTFVDIPVNPTANDVEFQASVPYLAPAHE